jgi:uncharacterized repeat protein (TIGR02543 family)
MKKKLVLWAIAVLVFTGCEDYLAGKSEPALSRYTIVFDSQGGSAVSPISAGGGTAVAKPADPEKTDYSFLGWYSAANGGTLYIWPHTLTANLTMYAQWQYGNKSPLPQYTVTFDSRGGSVVPPISADEGTAVAKPADPEKSGYSFLGWYSAAVGGTLYTWPHSLTGSLTMYAQWRADSEPSLPQYTVTFDSQGGSAVPPVSAGVGTAVGKPTDPEKPGYSFLGWYSAANGGTLYTWPHTLTGSLTMYGRWSADTYTISYVLNNGTNALENPSSYTVESSGINLAAPTRSGYTFMGWYDDGGFTGNPVTTILAGSMGNRTLYARWSADTYTISYVLNNGTNAPENPSSYTVESPGINLAAPTRSGYTFMGWYDNGGFTGSPIIAIPAGSMGNRTFYARWNLDSYNRNITLTIDNFIDPAQGAFADTAFTLTRPNGTKTITVTDNGTDIKWYVGLAKIAEGNSLTLNLAVLNLSPGRHSLRVTAKYNGVLHSKEITFTVNG